MGDDEVRALHNAARRYCLDRAAHYRRVYEQARAPRPDTFAYTYTVEDYAVFPCYVVLDQICGAIERWTPDEVESIDAARARLHLDGEVATTITQPAIAVRAIERERVAFARFVATSTAADWAAMAPVPGRRVLAADDADARYADFAARWGNWSGGYSDRAGLDVLVLDDEVRAALPLVKTLRAILAGWKVERVIELREYGDCAEIEVATATFQYNGAEGNWVTDGTWMINASHESSIAIGGAALIAAVRAALPTIDTYYYDGWDNPPSARR